MRSSGHRLRQRLQVEEEQRALGGRRIVEDGGAPENLSSPARPPPSRRGRRGRSSAPPQAGGGRPRRRRRRPRAQRTEQRDHAANDPRVGAGEARARTSVNAQPAAASAPSHRGCAIERATSATPSTCASMNVWSRSLARCRPLWRRPHVRRRAEREQRRRRVERAPTACRRARAVRARRGTLVRPAAWNGASYVCGRSGSEPHEAMSVHSLARLVASGRHNAEQEEPAVKR